MKKRILYASLIGINKYEEVTPLYGCVLDILKMDAFLREFCAQQKEVLDYQPLCLLSPDKDGKEAIEDYKKNDGVRLEYSDATFEHVTQNAFAHLAKANDDNRDICLFYFSGHGFATTDVPSGFPDQQLETLVFQDSRSDARDLRDKELAYLLYRLLKDKPNVHCLVITDCCHGGGVTRGTHHRHRAVSNPDKGVKFEDFLGFKDGFFRWSQGQIVYPYADYIHLAACTAEQMALDMVDGGRFSKALVELLRDGGSGYSYRHLIQSLSATLSAPPQDQTPVPVSREDRKLDQKFLGDGLLAYVPSFELRYNSLRKRWQLNAGEIQGLIPSGKYGKTRVAIEGTNIEAEVVTVEMSFSIVQGNDLKFLNVSNNSYRAALIEVAIPPKTLDCSTLNDRMKRKLKFAFDRGRYLYVKPTYDPIGAHHFLAEEKEQGFSLFGYPYISPRLQAKTFLDDVEKIARWEYFRNLKSSSSIFSVEDFVFTVEKIEEKRIDNSESLARLNGEVTRISPNNIINLAYKNNRQPAFRFSIGFRKDSQQEKCHVAALYFGSEFGIYSHYILPQASLSKNGRQQLNYEPGNSLIHAIPLLIDPAFDKNGIDNVDEYLKIVVADRPLDVSSIRQPALAFDEKKSMRSGEEGRKVSKEAQLNAVFPDRYATFDFPIRLYRPKRSLV